MPRPLIVVGLLEAPSVPLLAAVTTDTASVPIAPALDERWRKSSAQLRRCSRAGDPTSCGERMPGRIWVSTRGRLVKITDPRVVDAFRAKRPPVVRFRWIAGGAGEEIPLRYAP